ncbi:COG2958 family protein [Palleronia abyssalis]|nr:HrgA protein [Palleronia abyssalis]
MKIPTLKLAKRIPEILREQPDHRFKARELAQLIRERHPDACEAKLHNSPSLSTERDLLQQIVAEIGSQRPAMQRACEEIRVTDGRPRQYYWATKSDAEEAGQENLEDVGEESATASGTRPKLSEADLYPLLGEFAYRELGVDAMRIDERKGTNSGAAGTNRWLYPDVVGFEDVTVDWDRDLKLCVSQTGDARARLWSFEVKLRLNRANVRECFFQCVSNSSWANSAYLVAVEIGDGTLKELRTLSQLHGIGVIQLDPENPTESQILIPTNVRSSVDWASCNRLLRANGDFRNFIKKVRQFYQTGDRPETWDLLPDD